MELTGQEEMGGYAAEREDSREEGEGIALNCTLDTPQARPGMGYEQKMFHVEHSVNQSVKRSY